MLNNSDYTIISFALILLASISSATILYLVFFILFSIFRFSKNFILYSSAFVFAIANIALIVDFFIYKIYKFHINAMVLNILTSPDAMDSIQVGTAPVIAFIAFVSALILFEFYIIKKLFNWDEVNKDKLNKKLNKLIILPLFLIILVEKVSYGSFTLFSKSELVSKFKVIPLYQPLTFSRIAKKVFNYIPPQQVKNTISTDAQLNYPLAKITVKENPNKFNIFIFASDAVKNSEINSETTPNIENFKKDSIVFNNHFSGGNSTRFGIFSIFYGLNSTYWFSFLNTQKSPILIDILKDLNYNFNISTSTSTSWPEFRETAYKTITSSIKDDFKGHPWQRDKQNTNYFLNFIKNYNSDKSLFSFVFLDAPHGYSYPQTANKFNAKNEAVNYLNISKGSDSNINAYKRYKNSIYYNDLLFAKMIKSLKDKGLYENSLIIYTSDHGQEFFEYGKFGHNSSFSIAQVNTPFIIKLPKSMQKNHQMPKDYPNILTSHNDIVPTILNMIGITNNSSDYSNGYNIFDKGFHRNFVPSSNWNNNAIITKDRTYIFSNLPNKMFKNEVRDTQTYKKVDQKEKIDPKILLKVLNENKMFLK